MVSALAAVSPVRSVVNVDQPLRLAGFQDGLRQLEPLLRGTDEQFASAITMLFDAMSGPLAGEARARVDALRSPRREVVLGTWASVLESSAEELEATVAQLGTAVTAPYLSLHGIDPGEAYAGWLTSVLGSPDVDVEVWADHGHYPQLVDAPRFVERLTAWTAAHP